MPGRGDKVGCARQLTLVLQSIAALAGDGWSSPMTDDAAGAVQTKMFCLIKFGVGSIELLFMPFFE